MNKTDAAILAARNTIIREEIDAIRNCFYVPQPAQKEIRNVLALDTLSGNVGRPVFGRLNFRQR